MLLTFLVGAAAGAAIAYFLTSDKKEEMVADFKEKANKLKDEINNMGTKVADEIKNKTDEFFTKPSA